MLHDVNKIFVDDFDDDDGCTLRTCHRNMRMCWAAAIETENIMCELKSSNDTCICITSLSLYTTCYILSKNNGNSSHRNNDDSNFKLLVLQKAPTLLLP